jgi:hypothetical protein
VSAPIIGAALAGAAAGALADDAYEHGKQAVTDALGVTEPQHDGIETALLLQAVLRVEAALAAYRRYVDLNEIVTLNQPVAGTSIVAGYQVSMKGRRHLSLYSPVAFTLDVVYGPIGTVKFYMLAGWNALDAPDNSVLSVDPSYSAASVTVVLRYGEDSLNIAGA